MPSSLHFYVPKPFLRTQSTAIFASLSSHDLNSFDRMWSIVKRRHIYILTQCFCLSYASFVIHKPNRKETVRSAWSPIIRAGTCLLSCSYHLYRAVYSRAGFLKFFYSPLKHTCLCHCPLQLLSSSTYSSDHWRPTAKPILTDSVDVRKSHGITKYFIVIFWLNPVMCRRKAAP